jgi:hypothetical protein
MKNSGFRRFLALGAFTACGTLFQFGCSLDRVGRSIWEGFGFSIGAIPAQFVADALLGFVTPPADEG